MSAAPKLWLVGLSHHSAPVELRERLAFENGALPDSLRRLREVPGVREGAMLSTCNRVEVLALGDRDADVRGALGRFLELERGLPEADFGPHLYHYEDRRAVRHLFRVAASLDSMVVGEPQILGQLKESYQTATEAEAVGTVLHRAFHKAFSVAKRVRSETGIGGRRVSISSVAVELATQIFEALRDKTAMVLGAGKMSELTARHLRTRGIGTMIFANRTFDRAVELAREHGGTAVPMDQLQHYLPMSDVILGSVGGAGPVLTRDMVQAALRARSHRPMFLIDLGVPRNFDPYINDLADVYLYDIDDLEGVIADNRDEREREAGRAEAIVEAEVESFWRWFESLDAVPTIVELRHRAEAIRRAELERTLAALPDLGPEGRKTVEAMADAILKKILHTPISRLKGTGPEAADDLAALRRLFGLDDS